MPVDLPTCQIRVGGCQFGPIGETFKVRRRPLLPAKFPAAIRCKLIYNDKLGITLGCGPPASAMRWSTAPFLHPAFFCIGIPGPSWGVVLAPPVPAADCITAFLVLTRGRPPACPDLAERAKKRLASSAFALSTLGW